MTNSIRRLSLLVSMFVPVAAAVADARVPGADRVALLSDYAQRVLIDGAAPAGSAQTPLLANGIKPTTKEQLEWRFSNGKSAVISDLASQQNFLRFLVGLSVVTTDPRYGAVARANFSHYFAHLRDSEGLLQWGGHRFVDLKTLAVVGPLKKRLAHEMKNVVPYYDLMFETDPQGTARFVEAFWADHVLDWENLVVNRHSPEVQHPPFDWSNGLGADAEPLRECKGLTFLNTGNDLIYSAVQLYLRTGDRRQLGQAKRLLAMYWGARNPDTELGAYQYSVPIVEREPAPGEDRTMSHFGDRAKAQFGPEFGDHVREYSVLFKGQARTIYGVNALVCLDLARALGAEERSQGHGSAGEGGSGAGLRAGEVGLEPLGLRSRGSQAGTPAPRSCMSAGSGAEWPELVTKTERGLRAYVKHGFDEKTRMMRPLLSDGRDLTGHTLARDGYYGKKGAQMKQYRLDGSVFLALVRCYKATKSAETLDCIRKVAPAFGLFDVSLFDLGSEGAIPRRVLCNDPLVLVALVDLWAATGERRFLDVADLQADHLLKMRYHNGYFTAPGFSGFAAIDALEPYALLYLEAAKRGVLDSIPVFVGSSGFVQGDYLCEDGVTRDISENKLYE